MWDLSDVDAFMLSDSADLAVIPSAIALRASSTRRFSVGDVFAERTWLVNMRFFPGVSLSHCAAVVYSALRAVSNACGTST